MRPPSSRWDTNPHDSGPRRRKAMLRVDRAGSGRYLTFSCFDQLQLFKSPAIRDHFARHLRAARERGGFLLRAWVVMPEHVHLLIRPTTDDGSVSKTLMRLKREFAREVISRWRELGAPILNRITPPDGRPRFWQRGGGYDRLIWSHQEFWEKVDYIHKNPIRRGLVQAVCDWKWSSARAYAGLEDVLVEVDIDHR